MNIITRGYGIGGSGPGGIQLIYLTDVQVEIDDISAEIISDIVTVELNNEIITIEVDEL